jgi:hypothetical protein
MGKFYQEAKCFVLGALANRESMIVEKKPSKYWTDFAANFRYVYDLVPDELSRIRYHTYHLTSDIYLTYYFASDGFKKLLADGYRYFVDSGGLLPIDEGATGIGVETEYGRVSHDLLRYIGVMTDIKKAGLLDHTHPKSVLEIGGGYGGLARAHLYQNPSVRYVICDLEETLFFSAIYLFMHFGDDRVHLVDASLRDDSLEAGHIYIVPQSRMELMDDLQFNYSVSQQSFQEMTQPQVNVYLEWLSKHSDYFYSCNINDHGTLALDKQLITNLGEQLLEAFSRPLWVGCSPMEGNRFGDNHLPRTVFQCRKI